MTKVKVSCGDFAEAEGALHAVIDNESCSIQIEYDDYDAVIELPSSVFRDWAKASYDIATAFGTCGWKQ